MVKTYGIYNLSRIESEAVTFKKNIIVISFLGCILEKKVVSDNFNEKNKKTYEMLGLNFYITNHRKSWAKHDFSHRTKSKW